MNHDEIGNGKDLVPNFSYYVWVKTDNCVVEFRDALVSIQWLDEQHDRLESIWAGLKLICFSSDMMVQRT